MIGSECFGRVVLSELECNTCSGGGRVRQRRAGKGNNLKLIMMIAIQIGCIPMHAVLHLRYRSSYHAK